LQFVVERMPSASEIVATLNSQNYGWTSFSPTTQGFGTTTSNECFHARDGEDMLIRCKFTTGTVTASEARLTLPNGLTSKSTAFIPTIQNVGQWARGAASASNYGGILIEPGVTYVTFGAVYAAAANPFTKLNGTGVAGSSELLNITARVPIAEWTNSQPVPVFVGSVSTNSTGAERIERAYVAATCSATPCTIASQSGNWLSSISRSGTGAYSLNFTSGIFSGVPSCTILPANPSEIRLSGTPTSSAFTFQTFDSAGSFTDGGFSVLCMGPR